MTADLFKILNYYSIQLNGKPLAYVQGKGFFLVERYRDNVTGEQKSVFESFDGTTTLFDLPQDTKVYYLDNDKSLAQLVRDGVATVPQDSRNSVGIGAAGWRFTVANAELSDAQERIAEKYGIEDLAAEYENPFLKQILSELRKLTIEVIERATRNKKGKREILLIWEQVRKQAEQNNLVELEDLRDRLLRLSGKQKRGENAALIREAKKEIREELWGKVIRTLKIWTAVVVFFVSVPLAVSFTMTMHKKEIINQKETEKTVADSVPTLTEARIKQMINLYNSQHSETNIYQWREGKIIEFLTRNYTALTDTDLQKAIDTLATTRYPFWKTKH
jgi:uncharacterized protein (DUF433 family)